MNRSSVTNQFNKMNAAGDANWKGKKVFTQTPPSTLSLEFSKKTSLKDIMGFFLQLFAHYISNTAKDFAFVMVNDHTRLGAIVT
uniref:Uncharacterized protein n=1 Tax=Ascaris lumbricoides TaxID=6252 RepID=A0A9J2PBL1_ASCLU